MLDANDVQRALTRIAHEVLERNKGARNVVLFGVPTRGVPLARRLAARIAEVEGIDVPVGSLDITMYRDDLRLRPTRSLERTDVPPDGIDGAIVVLVDDVLFSGRTIRAALDALADLGRPRLVQLAVLVETTLLHPRRGFIKLEDTVAVTDNGWEAFGDHGRGWNLGRAA